MNLLDRYIFKSVFATCLGAVALFAFVLTVGNIMKELMPFYLAGQIDLLFFLRMAGMLVVYTATFALPMGVLTGVLLTLGRLSADSEITAIRASGVSLLRLSKPIILLGLLLSATALYINEQVGPMAKASFKREMAEAIRANPLSLLVPRTFIRQFDGFVVYVGEKRGREIEDLSLWQLDKQQRATRLIRARSGTIDYDTEANALVLTLRDAVVELRDVAMGGLEKNGNEHRGRDPESTATTPWVSSFGETEQVRLSLDKYFTNSAVRMKEDFLPHSDLVRLRDQRERIPANETPAQRNERERLLARVKLILSERMNNALAVFAFALIAVPLGIKVSRRETSANLGVAVAIALGYFVCTSSIGWLQRQPQTMPWLLLYLPNLCMIAGACWLFKRVEKR